MEFKTHGRLVDIASGVGLGAIVLVALLLSLRVSVTAAPDQTTWYVHPDGLDSDPGTSAQPFATIGRGIDAADSGDTILVAGGTYTENLVIEDKTLTLRGGYTVSGTLWLSGAAETIVNGNRADRVFLIHSGSNVALERLTITGGKAPEEQCWGGGVSVTNGELFIRSSRITGNEAVCSSGVSGGGAGGGVDANRDEGPASLTIEDSIIFNNSAKDHGGAVNTWRATVNLTNVLVISNTHHVLALSESNTTIVNSTIADNATDGNAILDFGGTAATSVINILNSIVWNSGGMDCDTCTATYSDIQGGWPGVGNIDADPQFADPASDDYRLSLVSPCVDTGTDAGAPDHDLDQTPRPLDGDGDGTATTDMGAYESTGFFVFLPLVVK